MITHFAQLQLNTVSVQGVKQFYHDRLCFPIVYESDNEIRFQPTEYFTLSFKESYEPLAPVHFAFEVSYSEFEHVVNGLQSTGIILLKWTDGRMVGYSETGKNVYFRDGDGNLLELIAHSYVKEGILPPSGELKILYLREVGFPVDRVVNFRERLVRLFDFKLDKVLDNFTFAIGGTSHVVIASKERKWIPIAMTALPPTTMSVSFGVSSSEFIDKVKNELAAEDIGFEAEEDGGLYFNINDYRIHLCLTDCPKEIPALLNLPYSGVGND